MREHSRETDCRNCSCCSAWNVDREVRAAVRRLKNAWSDARGIMMSLSRSITDEGDDDSPVEADGGGEADIVSSSSSIAESPKLRSPIPYPLSAPLARAKMGDMAVRTR